MTDYELQYKDIGYWRDRAQAAERERDELQAMLERFAPKDWDETLGINYYVWQDVRAMLDQHTRR